MRLTTRGKIVLGILIILAVFAIVEVSQNLWWTGETYCWGSAVKCLGGAL